MLTVGANRNSWNKSTKTTWLKVHSLNSIDILQLIMWSTLLASLTACFLSLSIPNRQTRPEQCVSHWMHAGKYYPCTAAPSAGQPSRWHIPFPQAVAEAGRPSAASDWACFTSPGDQEDRRCLLAPTASGDLQRHVLRMALNLRDGQIQREVRLRIATLIYPQSVLMEGVE